jgi:hypothetical protein
MCAHPHTKIILALQRLSNSHYWKISIPISFHCLGLSCVDKLSDLKTVRRFEFDRFMFLDSKTLNLCLGLDEILKDSLA